MALPGCQRNARCLLLALSHYGGFSKGLRESPALTCCHLRRNEAISAQHFYRHVFTMQNPTRKCWLSRAGCARYMSEGGVNVLHPENNQPSISQKQQEVAVIPREDVDTFLEELDDDALCSSLDIIPEDEGPQIAPIPPSSSTLRDYVDHSETLQKLVMLGVDLSKLEKRPNVGTFLLKLDFETDISKILFFLKDVGVEDSQLGHVLTKNPFILSEDLDNLQKRVAYLRSRKFSQQAIARMVSRAPYLLNFSVERLDNRLGFFQKQLGLSAENTRDIVTRLPRMVTGSLEPIRENLKVFEIELGFRKNEIQHIALRVPKVLTAQKKRITETFDYVHNTMGIPHNVITKFPQIFNSSLLKIKERHMFLAFLGRAVYDPTQANYISLEKVASMPDDIFCQDVAKASTQDFDEFRKTM
ncbi:PREDICTED: transcription termination factor 3, mitochondrial [Nanorana parkeri]|uniref:transcription termination factor 3, mitochondrial n=1 Tax=Nanorana parkeri TaxID=125878 RepID=UPI00085454EC|nr:PREDICTED: transcription termination factor 3, mitochondrial [Nanorana parkeri]